jgi:hypothetical protein
MRQTAYGHSAKWPVRLCCITNVECCAFNIDTLKVIMLRVGILSAIMLSVVAPICIAPPKGAKARSVMVAVASVFAPRTSPVWTRLKQSCVFLMNQVGVAEETKNLLAWMALKPFIKIHKIFIVFLCHLTPNENFYKWHLWQLWHLASLKVLQETSHPLR